jgi:hypothetical protein
MDDNLQKLRNTCEKGLAKIYEDKSDGIIHYLGKDIRGDYFFQRYWFEGSKWTVTCDIQGKDCEEALKSLIDLLAETKKEGLALTAVLV